jgi:hypothetical protein
MWEPQPLTTLRASKACRGENFAFCVGHIVRTLFVTARLSESGTGRGSTRASSGLNLGPEKPYKTRDYPWISSVPLDKPGVVPDISPRSLPFTSLPIH